jgi:hypothetical protein
VAPSGFRSGLLHFSDRGGRAVYSAHKHMLNAFLHENRSVDDEPVGGIEVFQVCLRMKNESAESCAARVRENRFDERVPVAFTASLFEDRETLQLRGRQTVVVNGSPPGRSNDFLAEQACKVPGSVLELVEFALSIDTLFVDEDRDAEGTEGLLFRCGVDGPNVNV